MKKFIFSHFHRFFFLPLLVLIMTIFSSGCQKEVTDNPTNYPPANTEFEKSGVVLERMALEYNFHIPSNGLKDSEVLTMYKAKMATLSDADQKELITLFDNFLVQERKKFSVPVLGAKSMETILSEGTVDDGFGIAVTTEGNKVYVGARNVQKVFEYEKTGGLYVLTNEIIPEGPSKDFGFTISVSGSWMAVGAPEFGPPYPSGAGKVFMFKKQGGNWVQKSILYGPSGDYNFGGDGLVLKGNTLAAVSRHSESPPASNITIFKGSGNTWVDESLLMSPGYAFFSIDMNSGANRIAGTGAYNGSLASVRAVIFSKSGGTWVQDDEVIIPPSGPGSIGIPRDIALDNNTIVLTAIIPGDTHWVISKTGNNWSVSGNLIIPATALGSRLAAIHGEKIVIGAANGSNPVYLFEKLGNDWSLTDTFIPGDGGSNAAMYDLSIHDNTIVSGVPGFVGTAGRAYVYD
jgi:hypothetical protein